LYLLALYLFRKLSRRLITNFTIIVDFAPSRLIDVNTRPC
jgi:hypothetical protein